MLLRPYFHLKKRNRAMLFLKKVRLKRNYFDFIIAFSHCGQGVTKICRLSRMTNSSLVYEPKHGGKGGWGVSANEDSSAHGAQSILGDLTPYLIYGCGTNTPLS
jgi:hypothetical protein